MINLTPVKELKKNKKNNLATSDFASVAKMLSVIIATLGIMFLLFTVFMSGLLGVGNISVKGDKIIESEKIYSAAYPELDKNVNFIFKPRNFLPIVDERAVEKRIKLQFPFLEEIEVKKKYPNELEIKIRKAEPTLALKFESEDYITISNEGFPLDEVRQDQIGSLNLPIVEVSERKDDQIIDFTQRQVSEQFSNYVSQIIEFGEKRLGLIPIKISSTLSSDGKTINVEYGNGFTVRYFIEIDARKSIETLARILPEIIPENTNTVDLRLDGTYYITCKINPCII